MERNSKEKGNEKRARRGSVTKKKFNVLSLQWV